MRSICFVAIGVLIALAFVAVAAWVFGVAYQEGRKDMCFELRQQTPPGAIICSRDPS